MRRCTLESSLFPLSAADTILVKPLHTHTHTLYLLSFFLSLSHTHHTDHVKEPKKQNICQCTHLHNEHQGKKVIYIHLRMALYSTNSLHHTKNTVNNI